MLYQVNYTPQIGRNVLRAFKQIHARGICHGDVRPENILVRPDQSVVVIDFEMSEVMAPREALVSEMSEVKGLLASSKARSSRP
jgi:tRNA A-37 threonylcarbamoyl transferase component Bud32